VAFMLVHYFWLLEFKFKFEFYCLNPFLKYLNPFPLPTLSLSLFNPPTYPARSAFQPSRPPQPLIPALQPNPAAAGPAAVVAAARFSRAMQPSGFAARPAQLITAASRSPPPHPVPLTGGTPVSSPSSSSSPTRTRLRRRHRVRPAHAHPQSLARTSRTRPRAI
jgi:hypothetical protein